MGWQFQSQMHRSAVSSTTGRQIMDRPQLPASYVSMPSPVWPPPQLSPLTSHTPPVQILVWVSKLFGVRFALFHSTRLPYYLGRSDSWSMWSLAFCILWVWENSGPTHLRTPCALCVLVWAVRRGGYAVAMVAMVDQHTPGPKYVLEACAQGVLKWCTVVSTQKNILKVAPMHEMSAPWNSFSNGRKSCKPNFRQLSYPHE